MYATAIKPMWFIHINKRNWNKKYKTTLSLDEKLRNLIVHHHLRKQQKKKTAKTIFTRWLKSNWKWECNAKNTKNEKWHRKKKEDKKIIFLRYIYVYTQVLKVTIKRFHRKDWIMKEDERKIKTHVHVLGRASMDNVKSNCDLLLFHKNETSENKMKIQKKKL